MKLKTQIIETEIIFELGKINVLGFEELNVFRRFIYSLHQYHSEGMADEEIMIVKDNQQVNIADGCFILTDFYNIDFHSPNIIKKIVKNLEEEYRNHDDYRQLLQQINESIEKFTQMLFLNYSVELISRKLEIRDYLKLLSIKPDISLYKTPFEKVLFLLNLVQELKLYELIVLVDLKKYCTVEQIIEVYKLALYHDVKILLIESNSSHQLLKYEKKVVIAEDFSEHIIESS